MSGQDEVPGWTGSGLPLILIASSSGRYELGCRGQGHPESRSIGTFILRSWAQARRAGACTSYD